MPEKMDYDVVIIGGGTAGMTAAIYTCRKKLSTLIVTIDVGGQNLLTEHEENYPGYLDLSGPKLMSIFEGQARNFGAEFVFGKTNKVEKIAGGFRVSLANGESYTCRALVLAYGKVPRALGVPGEDKFMGRGVSTCATCLPPQEIVIANSSARSIQSIRPEDRVLTIDGTFQDVIEKTEREFDGDLIEIKTRFFTEPVKLTANHPVLKMGLKKGKGANYWNFKFSEPEWLEAGALKAGDLVLYPIIKENMDKDHILISDVLKDVEIDNNGLVKNRYETFSARRVPNKIEIDKNFMRLIGYYLSEGCITGRGVNFYFNKKEITYIEDVKNLFKSIFGIEPTIKTENNVCRIMVFSKIIMDFFEKLFGKYAHNKKLPHWAVILPVEKQSEIIKGVFRGDGCLRDKDFCIVTNSQILAYQLRDIFLRLKILPSLQLRKLEDLRPTEIGGRTINFRHDKYHIIIGGPSLNKMSEILGVRHPKLAKRNRVCRHAYFKDGFVLLPIRRVSRIRYNGKVQNMAVGNNQTYVAKNFIVHNCDAPVFKGKTVAVVGGGNSALEAAELLAKFAPKVYLIHRRDSFRADEITVEKVKNYENVEFVLNSVPLEIKGDKFVSGIVVEDMNTKKKRELAVNGIFVEIGYIVDTSFVRHLVEVNTANEIIVNNHCETKEPGIFAAGDVTDVPYKQTVISAGMGATAGLSAYNYLMKLEGKTGAKIDWS